MMKTGTAIAVVFAGLALAPTASAADLGQSLLQAPELPATKSTEAADGWYLRGDIGYAFDATGDADTDWSGSGGAGYRFNDLLRSDVTVGYDRGTFDGAGSQKFSAYGIMLNGYVDLGTFVGLTPYIGAGVGLVDVDWGTYTTAAGATFPGVSDWRFAYQLSAGLAYALTNKLRLDVGYRYLKVAGGERYGGAGGDDGFARNEVRAGLRYTIR